MQSAAQTKYVHRDLRLHHSMEPQYGSQTPTWPLVTSRTLSELQEGPILKVKPSLSQASVPAQIQGKTLARNLFRYRVCICVSSRLLHIMPLTLLGNDNMSKNQPSLTPVTIINIMSPVLPFSIVHTLLHFPISPLLHHVCSLYWCPPIVWGGSTAASSLIFIII